MAYTRATLLMLAALCCVTSEARLLLQEAASSNCYYGNSSTPLYCDSPPPVQPSPPPPSFPPPPVQPSPPPAPPRNPNCFYGNSSTPLYCNNPPPPPAQPSPPPPAPRNPNCFYGNSSTPLFCNNPPPPVQPSPPPPSPKSPSPSPTPSSPNPPVWPTPSGPANGLQPIFTTGAADYKMVTVTRPANSSLDKVAVQAADDFFVPNAVTIQGFSFEGLLPQWMDPATVRSYITSVNFLLYQLFPSDSNLARVLSASDPLQGTANVVARSGSPADTPQFNSSTQATPLQYQVVSLGSNSVTVPIAINDYNIQPRPNQLQTGNSAPTSFTGQRYQFFIPYKLSVTAGTHLYFVPQVGLDCNLPTPAQEDACNFMWASAPYPVTSSNGGTSFPAGVTDEQTWISSNVIAPDWERIGADVVGASAAYNAAFTVWA